MLSLKNIELFKSLSENEIEKIENNASVRNYANNEVIHNPHEKCDSLSIILNGNARVCSFMNIGNEQNLKNLTEGDIFGEALIFSEKHYPSYIISNTPTTVMEISKLYLLNALKNEKFLVSYLHSIAEKIFNLSFMIEILSLSTVEKRVSKYLLSLSQIQESNNIYIPYNKTQIANKIGTSRETVSRIFSKLKKEKIIKQNDNKSITIISSSKLEKILFGQ